MKRRVPHKLSKTPTYKSWLDMKARCFNIKNKNYINYGGRGITVCESWRNSFLTFLSDMGEKPKQHTLDRIENDKSYSKENCKWSTYTEQANNTRRNLTFNGETAVQASRRLGGGDKLVSDRVTKLNWTLEEAFLTPYIENKSKDKNKQRRILCHSDL